MEAHLDCFSPKKSDGLLVDKDLVERCGEVKTWLGWRGQHVKLPLCSACAGFVLGEGKDGGTFIDVESGTWLSKEQDRWNRWHHLCVKYELLLPLLPQTELNYYETYEDKVGNQYHYPPMEKVSRCSSIWRINRRTNCRIQNTNICHRIGIAQSFGFFNFCTSLCGNTTRRSMSSYGS